MKIPVNTWGSFRAGDVIVEPSFGPEPVIVEREQPEARFGTAQVDGESRRGFLTPSNRFVYVMNDGYNVTATHSEFVADPDWKAALDAFVRRLENVRRGIISMYSDGAARQALLAIVDDGNEAPKPAPLQLSRERLVGAMREAVDRINAGATAYASQPELLARAVEILLQKDLGIEPKP